MPRFIISIFDKEQRPVAVLKYNNINDVIKIEDNYIEFFVTHTKIQLSKGVYSIHLNVFKMYSNEPILRINDIFSFQIIDFEDVWPPFFLKSTYQGINN